MRCTLCRGGSHGYNYNYCFFLFFCVYSTPGTFVRIVDAVKGPFYPSDPPFPTFDVKDLPTLKESETFADYQIFAPMSATDRGNFPVPTDPLSL